MVMCYCYGDVVLLWRCVTVMAMCYCYGDVLLLWRCVAVMVMCYCYGDVLLAPIPNFHKDRWKVIILATCFGLITRPSLSRWSVQLIMLSVCEISYCRIG